MTMVTSVRHDSDPEKPRRLDAPQTSQLGRQQASFLLKTSRGPACSERTLPGPRPINPSLTVLLRHYPAASLRVRARLTAVSEFKQPSQEAADWLIPGQNPEQGALLLNHRGSREGGDGGLPVDATQRAVMQQPARQTQENGRPLQAQFPRACFPLSTPLSGQTKQQAEAAHVRQPRLQPGSWLGKAPPFSVPVSIPEDENEGLKKCLQKKRKSE